MPRTPRLDHPGARHHVMNRAARREAIFADDVRCALLLDAVAQVPLRFGARIHGYALMPNHYHLMVEVPQGNLSQVMRFVGAQFSQAYNRLMGFDGPVFRGRFHNEVVSDDAYWMHLLAYLHLNPVKARLAKSPGDSIWSSHLAYLEPQLRPEWLTTDELLGMFGSAANLAAYTEDVRLKRRGAPEGFDPERFFKPPVTTPSPVEEPPPARTVEQVLADVAEVTGVPVERVLDRPRGRSANAPAWMAAHWLSRATDLSQTDIAEILGVSRPRVSQLQEKIRALARAQPEVAEQLQALERLLLGGSGKI